MFLLSRLSKENRNKRRLWKQNLKAFKQNFEKTMIDWKMADSQPSGWNIMDLWATAIMMDEAKTLSRLTRWLIVLSTVLSVLTFVLAYPLITGVLAGLK
jgi:hypothetical protein